MTNTVYFNSLIPELSPDIVGAILDLRGLAPEAEYSVSKESQLAEADILMKAVILPEFSEGSLRIKYNVAKLDERANFYYKLHGDLKNLNEGQPTIKKLKL